MQPQALEDPFVPDIYRVEKVRRELADAVRWFAS